MTKKRLRLWATGAVGCALVLASCSPAPMPVRPGTPAFYWAAAESAWRAEDYLKTSDMLDQLLRGENEYAPRARVWQIVVASGLAQGYSDLSDSYQAGSRYNRSDTAVFREQVRVARAAAAQLSLRAGETVRAFLDRDESTSIVPAFTYPAATTTAEPHAAKLAKGILLKGAEAEAFQAVMLQRGIARMASRMAAAEVFAKGIPREQFLTATAAAVFEQSSIFGPKKLDQPDRLQGLCTLAQDALRSVPPNAKTQELQGNIKRTLGQRRPT